MWTCTDNRGTNSCNPTYKNTILVSNEHYVQESKCITSVTMSDHYPIGLCWKMKNSQKTANHKLISYRRTKSLNFEHLSESINCKLLNENLPSVDTQVRNFTSTLNSELVKHALIIHKRVKLNKQPTWSNEDILQHIKKRNNYKR